MEMAEINIASLNGSRDLTGVDVFLDDRPDLNWDGSMTSVLICRVQLDGGIYEFSENPDDGYRSLHDGPFLIESKIKNEFNAVPTICQHIDKSSMKYGDGADILRIVNVKTGSIILDVGTENANEYYPFFVCNFSAEAIGRKTVPKRLSRWFEGTVRDG